MSIIKIPDLIEVDSSNITRIGYDAIGQKLYVEFGDDLYAYDPVTQEAWEEFQKSESKGKWVWANLRNKQTKYEIVTR